MLPVGFNGDPMTSSELTWGIAFASECQAIPLDDRSLIFSLAILHIGSEYVIKARIASGHIKFVIEYIGVSGSKFAISGEIGIDLGVAEFKILLGCRERVEQFAISVCGEYFGITIGGECQVGSPVVAIPNGGVVHIGIFDFRGGINHFGRRKIRADLNDASTR